MRGVTQERLKEMLTYDPETGLFTGNCNTRGRRAGEVAGSLTRRGYVDISIDGYGYRAHRLAFLYMTGEMPPLVDHRDCNRSNNIWKNLRESDPITNSWNKSLNKSTLSGVKGVSWDSRYRNFQAVIWARGESHYIGRFKNIEDAEAAVREKRAELHGEFANHGYAKVGDSVITRSGEAQ